MSTNKKEKEEKFVFIDPPSGHRYGFPKKVKADISEEEIIELLKKSKYPENDIEFALKWMRFSE